MGLVPTHSLKSTGEVTLLFPWRDTDMSENLLFSLLGVTMPLRRAPNAKILCPYYL